MMGFLGGQVSPATLGLAFNVLGAIIAVIGFASVSDRAIAGHQKSRWDHNSAAARGLCMQRYDLRWAAMLILAGFGLQLIGSAVPQLQLDGRLWLALVIAVVTYMSIRGATVRHDVVTALGNLVDDTAAGVARFPRAAA